jgi:DNA mismatch repair ATPase MutS
MVRQYRELKAQHPGTLLFFRLGDFYELFFEDAVIGARELQITLTARHKESGDPIPMCGVPHHSAPNYIAKLVRKGYRVAICEQPEDASKTKKLVRREVVRGVRRALRSIRNCLSRESRSIWRPCPRMAILRARHSSTSRPENFAPLRRPGLKPGG